MRRHSRHGFTLVELLVVIGILIALVAILLPAVNKAYKTAQRTSMQADLAAISQALDAYRNDFSDYPRPDFYFSQNNPNVAAKRYAGAVLLCWGLVSPGRQGDGTGNPFGSDGAGDPNSANPQAYGPGFRVRGTTGKIYPSYLNLDRFKLGAINAGGNIAPSPVGQYDDNQSVILDRFGKPILYFPANRGVQVSQMNIGTYLGPSPYPGSNQQPTARFNANDAPLATLFSFNGNGMNLTGTQAMLRLMPGVNTQSGTGSQTLNTAETTTLPFLLWSAGPDGQFGSDDDATNLP